MALPPHVRKKLAKQKAEAKRAELIANAEKHLPKKQAALYRKLKDGGCLK